MLSKVYSPLLNHQNQVTNHRSVSFRDHAHKSQARPQDHAQQMMLFENLGSSHQVVIPQN